MSQNGHAVPVLSNEAARRVFLQAHALLEPPTGPAKGAALGALVARLGFVQVDSINTVARAHDLIIHARRPRYRAGGLARHLEQDRGLFEHWTHDAAMIPMAFYPHWRLKQRRDKARLLERYRDWREGDFEADFDRVQEHIEMFGPCRARDLGGKKTGTGGGWWDWHPTKTALEYLWRAGALDICHREGFAKVYELSHRVVPAEIHERAIPEGESVDWFCNGALDRLGFATQGQIADFWDVVSKQEARDWVSQAGLMEVDIEGADGKLKRHVMRETVFETAKDLPQAPSRMRVLSPFDPALRDRARAERLFGFAYRIEIFVPEPKRTYGYYVFPLMEGSRIVGRIDMKAERSRDRLIVKALWPEAGISWGKGRQARLCAALQRILPLAQVSEVEWETGWLRSENVTKL